TDLLLRVEAERFVVGESFRGWVAVHRRRHRLEARRREHGTARRNGMNALGEILLADRRGEAERRLVVPMRRRGVVERTVDDVPLGDAAEPERRERVDARIPLVVAFVRDVAAERESMREPREWCVLELHARRGAR